MRITKQGITFNYNNDEIIWFWWWARNNSTSYCGAFFSLIYNLSFNTFKEYWVQVGKMDKPLPISKLQGFGVEEILYHWVRQKMRVGVYVVLYDINIEAKPATFWRTIPDRLKSELTKDFVVLKCKDSTEAKNLVSAIPKTFATALLVYDGGFYYSDQPEV